jgi:integrase
MAVLAECPICNNKQSTRNKVCSGKNGCGLDLDKAKRSRKVRYWIHYRLPGGKQRKEFVGKSIQEARDADGKRKSQKRENRIFDMLPEARMRFSELADWYLSLKSVKKLASYNRVRGCIANFNKVFGDRIVNTIKPAEIEDYQSQRETDGLAPATIDMEISVTKTMINKAFDNDMVDGRTVKAFRKVERKLKKAANARRRTLSVVEYLRLREAAAHHLKAILTVAYNTGMRTGEIRKLRWAHIDWEKGFICLPAEIPKERKPKNIPMNHHVRETLKSLPHALHHDYVFTYKGEPIRDRGGLKRSFRTACKKADIPCGRNTPDGIIFHDIRRTVKTNMLNAGVNQVHRDLILGHSLQGMDAHYLVPNEDDLQREMDLYTRWLDEQIKNVTAEIKVG